MGKISGKTKKPGKSARITKTKKSNKKSDKSNKVENFNNTVKINNLEDLKDMDNVNEDGLNLEELENKEKIIKEKLDESKQTLMKLYLKAKLNKSNDSPQANTVNSSNTINSNIENMSDGVYGYSNTFEVLNSESNSMDLELNEDDEQSRQLIKIIDEEDNNYSIPTNVKIRSSNPNNSFVISRNNVGNYVKKSTDFDIDSKNHTGSDCYNDYMVDLNEPIKISDIKIKYINIPKNNLENITSENNQLKIKINGQTQIFELEENYYNRYEIIDFLNEAFQSYNFDIKCELDQDKIIFSSSTKFQMENHESSILPLLGFDKSTYVNKSLYTNENPHRIGDNIFYLVIYNISPDPLFYINNDTGEIKKLFDFEPINLDHLIIKFYKSSHDIVRNSKEYNFFFNDSHIINFEFVLG